MTVSQQSAAHIRHSASAPSAQSLVNALAQFFPDAMPLHLAVRVETKAAEIEQTVIEFGTGDEIIFASALQLEFGDRLTISTSDKSLEAELEVVALQFQGGAAAVAARFLERVPNWIVKR
jgi:hypothetical protein